ncbi:hypothetical protein BGZ61DRAFT_184279 [Ilyonectria robusta]|uniref:uncharacterized protein n=1 Tax=Ilyonectria robusta TaxID=1079257 RepID=UPI001E8EC319|nr:uncharacterized protein BGZ61DRAFT_184279 [Ilyonectria robusta]KAH8729580.1 hypothetical protein BGZ61DRAFT_184279 [Ilyonectria robusta]
MGRLDGSPEGGGRQGGMEGIRQSGLWSYGAMSSTGMGRKPTHRLEKQGCQWMQARYAHNLLETWDREMERGRLGRGGMIPRRTNASSSCKQLQGLHIISEPMAEPPAARPEVRGDPGLVEQVCMPSTGCHDRHGPFEARFFSFCSRKCFRAEAALPREQPAVEKRVWLSFWSSQHDEAVTHRGAGRAVGSAVDRPNPAGRIEQTADRFAGRRLRTYMLKMRRREGLLLMPADPDRVWPPTLPCPRPRPVAAL